MHNESRALNRFTIFLNLFKTIPKDCMLTSLVGKIGCEGAPITLDSFDYRPLVRTMDDNFTMLALTIILGKETSKEERCSK
jgi:hypothetical protein